jgi:hypothetical protein
VGAVGAICSIAFSWAAIESHPSRVLFGACLAAGALFHIPSVGFGTVLLANNNSRMRHLVLVRQLALLTLIRSPSPTSFVGKAGLIVP